MELLDEAISADSISSTPEVMKCVQIGLLCIQDHATDRPSMSSVALMLSSEMDLPNPKAPALTNFRSTSDHETQHQQESAPSINAVTCSICEGRQSSGADTLHIFTAFHFLCPHVEYLLIRGSVLILPWMKPRSSVQKSQANRTWPRANQIGPGISNSKFD